MEKALFISVKPEFVEKIFSGSKTIELRKSAPNVKRDDTIIIYCSSPVMSVIGLCKVKDIVVLSPNKLWNQYSSSLGIDKKRYFEYYEGKEIAVGIFLKDIKKFNKGISLASLRSKFNKFHPPQTFMYFDKAAFYQLTKQN